MRLRSGVSCSAAIRFGSLSLVATSTTRARRVPSLRAGRRKSWLSPSPTFRRKYTRSSFATLSTKEPSTKRLDGIVCGAFGGVLRAGTVSILRRARRSASRRSSDLDLFHGTCLLWTKRRRDCGVERLLRLVAGLLSDVVDWRNQPCAGCDRRRGWPFAVEGVELSLANPGREGVTHTKRTGPLRQPEFDPREVLLERRRARAHRAGWLVGAEAETAALVQVGPGRDGDIDRLADDLVDDDVRQAGELRLRKREILRDPGSPRRPRPRARQRLRGRDQMNDDLELLVAALNAKRRIAGLAVLPHLFPLLEQRDHPLGRVSLPRLPQQEVVEAVGHPALPHARV